MPESKQDQTAVIRLVAKDEFNPVLREVSQRLEAVNGKLDELKAELKAIAQLFNDNLPSLIDFKQEIKG